MRFCRLPVTLFDIGSWFYVWGYLGTFLEIFRDLRKIFGLKDLAENSHILSQIWLNCRKFWTFEAVFHKRKNNCTPAKYSVGPLHGCQVFFCDFLKIILYVDLVISRAQSQKNGKKSKMTEISVKLWALESPTSWKSGISGKLTPMEWVNFFVCHQDFYHRILAVSWKIL